MKKSLLALSVVAALLSTGCEDKSTPKLLEAEKTIMQLESQLKTAQNEVEKLQTEVAELATLKQEHEALKAELDKVSAHLPALQVEIVSLFDKSETIKLKPTPNEDYTPESSHIGLSVSIPVSGIEWLDQLLLKTIYRQDDQTADQTPSAEATTAPLNLDRLKQELAKQYDEMKAEAEENKLLGLSYELFSSYLGQRNHIASFSVHYDIYSGGAHGMYNTRYIHIDMDKKAVITLNELIAPGDQERVKAKLWARYVEERRDENDAYQGFVDEKTFRVSDDFYFSANGISFVYPPYELGPFAEGEVELTLAWHEINELLQPAFRLNKKDEFKNGE